MCTIIFVISLREHHARVISVLQNIQHIQFYVENNTFYFLHCYFLKLESINYYNI